MAKYNMDLFKMKAEFCKTLADPKRLVIIQDLLEGEKSVGELAAELELPQAVVSRNLSILREKGVVKSRREGTSVYYSLYDPRIGEACSTVHEILLKQIKESREFAESLES